MQTEIDVLRDVSRKFEQAGIAYMLTGSTAMNYYAEPRMTRDLDFGAFRVDLHRHTASARTADRNVERHRRHRYGRSADRGAHRTGEHARFARPQRDHAVLTRHRFMEGANARLETVLPHVPVQRLERGRIRLVGVDPEADVLPRAIECHRPDIRPDIQQDARPTRVEGSIVGRGEDRVKKQNRVIRRPVMQLEATPEVQGWQRP